MTQEQYELQNITVCLHEDSNSVPCNNDGAKMESQCSTDELTPAPDDIEGCLELSN